MHKWSRSEGIATNTELSLPVSLLSEEFRVCGSHGYMPFSSAVKGSSWTGSPRSWWNLFYPLFCYGIVPARWPELLSLLLLTLPSQMVPPLSPVLYFNFPWDLNWYKVEIILKIFLKWSVSTTAENLSSPVCAEKCQNNLVYLWAIFTCSSFSFKPAQR